MRTRIRPASAIPGDRIIDDQGQIVGRVEWLMVDIATGSIAYAVVALGNRLDESHRFLAVPWRALRMDETFQALVLNIDARSLEAAPTFDGRNMPDLASPPISAQLHAYYKVKPTWEGEFVKNVP